MSIQRTAREINTISLRNENEGNEGLKNVRWITNGGGGGYHDKRTQSELSGKLVSLIFLPISGSTSLTRMCMTYRSSLIIGIVQRLVLLNV
jgi:hypothetical protein